MSDELNSHTTDTGDTRNANLSASRMASRRRMLKAAAVSVPLIASLKSGAAFAVASANMCIVKNSRNQPENPALTPSDTWIQRLVTRYTFRNSDGAVTDAKYDIDGIYSDFVPDTINNYYDADGTPWVNRADMPVNSAESVYVLVPYQPSLDWMSVEESPFKLDITSPQTALTTSCLCSVDPSNKMCNII